MLTQKKQHNIIKVYYSSITNPEVMAFQTLVRNYTQSLKKRDIHIRYIKNIKIPFKMELYDKNKKKAYETTDYRRLKYVLERVDFFNN
jgi:hypothetical protein